LQHPKKKTIGIRIPEHKVTQLLLEELGEALFSTTLVLPPDTEALNDPYEIRRRLEHELDLIIDAGIVEHEPTTMIEISASGAEIIRQGKGLAPMLT
jgi:tRNA A37 threonylcarbamoyladenosine synthetase subunit TsaC/SUA5/YrdC